MSNLDELFGHSAVMLTRKKPVSWSFPKEKRFKQRKTSIDIGYLLLPSTLSPRSTIMGFGNRWTPRNEKGKSSPPPGSYQIPSSFDKKGPKIVKDSHFPSINIKFSTPGPGTYNFPSRLGKDRPKYTFHGSETAQRITESPAPGHYSPKTETLGPKGTSFGIGERVFFRKSLNGVPGPGTYEISSRFDNYKN
jgi:Sperm-tail PG-rich repeat